MAMRENGFGQLTTIELDIEVAQYATANIEKAGLSDWAHVIVGNSLDHRPEHEIQFVLLDFDIAIRHEEFRHYYDSLADGALVPAITEARVVASPRPGAERRKRVTLAHGSRFTDSGY
jgi:predicted O-methyltransferase YrrM